MSNSTTQRPKTVLSDRTYGILKWFVVLVLPAFGTLYGTLGETWNLPNTQQVVTTIVQVALFLGVVLGVSTKTYNNNASLAHPAKFDGELEIDTSSEDRDVFAIAIDDLDQLRAQETITLRVIQKEPPALEV